MSKVLVTGANGMTGRDLCAALAEAGFQVVATDIGEIDVSNLDLVHRTVQAERPVAVFHLAAMTDVDKCEKYPDEAYRVNATGTKNVALACQAFDATMVYTSTISVFDGSSAVPYVESDQPNPQSIYSKSKYQGELAVQYLLDRYYIVRAGWMFGGGAEDKKFVAKIAKLAQTRSELKVVNDKFGSPTYTVDFSKGMLNLIRTDRYGIYHMVNVGPPASRYEVAKAILEYAGTDGCEIEPVSSAEFPLPAPRPRMEAGRNLAAELIGLPPMRPWQEALRDYVRTTLLKEATDD